MKLVVIIPAKNEAETIAAVIKGIPGEIFGMAEKEIIVIDDGSTDETAEIAREAGAQVISHWENKGVGAAFSTGIKEALKRRADLVVTIDADGQFDSAEISKLIGPILEQKADFVLGSRFTRGMSSGQMPKIRAWGNKLMAKFISQVASQKLFDASCGFRAYSKEALLHLNLFGKFTYTQETILNLCFKDLKFAEVPITVRYFSGRKSDVTGNLFNYIFQVLRIIFRTMIDYQPLKFFGGIGVLLFSVGVILDAIMLYIVVKTGSFSPYIIVGVLGLTLNFFGSILFIIGLVANLLNRVRQNQERMLYYQKKKLYE